MTTTRGDLSPTSREDAVVDLLQRLGRELAESPAADRRAATRARLVAMAAVREPGRRPTTGPLRRLLGRGAPRRVTAGLAGAALTVCAFGGLLVASRDATPGDLLYGVKRGGEQTQLALAGDAGRGRTLLDLARTRLTELDAIDDPDAVVHTLGEMDELTTRGAREVTARSVAGPDPAALTGLGRWAAGQGAGLTALADDLPAPAGAALDGSASLVTAVADRATALARALECAGGPAVAGSDALGPLPAPCAPATARTATRDGAGGAAEDGAGDGGEVAAAPPAVPDGAGNDTPEPSADLPAAAPSATAGPTPPAAATTPPVPRPGAAARVSPSSASPSPTAPGRGRPPVPLPSQAQTPAAPKPPAPAPARPDRPPLVDLPLPLCVSALGLPVLC